MVIIRKLILTTSAVVCLAWNVFSNDSLKFTEFIHDEQFNKFYKQTSEILKTHKDNKYLGVSDFNLIKSWSGYHPVDNLNEEESDDGAIFELNYHDSIAKLEEFTTDRVKKNYAVAVKEASLALDGVSMDNYDTTVKNVTEKIRVIEDSLARYNLWASKDFKINKLYVTQAKTIEKSLKDLTKTYDKIIRKGSFFSKGFDFYIREINTVMEQKPKYEDGLKKLREFENKLRNLSMPSKKDTDYALAFRRGIREYLEGYEDNVIALFTSLYKKDNPISEKAKKDSLDTRKAAHRANLSKALAIIDDTTKDVSESWDKLYGNKQDSVVEDSSLDTSIDSMLNAKEPWEDSTAKVDEPQSEPVGFVMSAGNSSVKPKPAVPVANVKPKSTEPKVVEPVPVKPELAKPDTTPVVPEATLPVEVKVDTPVVAEESIDSLDYKPAVTKTDTSYTPEPAKADTVQPEPKQDTVTAKPKEQTIDSTVTFEPKDSYNPLDFKIETGVNPYKGTLGVRRGERLASIIISESAKAKKWVPVKSVPFYVDIPELVDMGYIKVSTEGFSLTKKALDDIAKKYSK